MEIAWQVVRLHYGKKGITLPSLQVAICHIMQYVRTAPLGPTCKEFGIRQVRFKYEHTIKCKVAFKHTQIYIYIYSGFLGVEFLP